MQQTMFKTGRVQMRLRKHSSQTSKPFRVTPALYQACLRYTILARLAPAWNKAGDWLVHGRDFLSHSGCANAVKWELTVTTDELYVTVCATVLRLTPLQLSHLDLSGLEVQSLLYSTEHSSGHLTLHSSWCRVLPSMKKGRLCSISLSVPEESPFSSYRDLKRHWKNNYGYRLPETDDDLFYGQISFWGVGGKQFTYPSICLRPDDLQSVPRVEAKPILSAFLQDLHSSVPSACGQSLLFLPQVRHVVTTLYTASQDVNGSRPNLGRRGSAGGSRVPLRNPRDLVHSNRPGRQPSSQLALVKAAGQSFSSGDTVSASETLRHSPPSTVVHGARWSSMAKSYTPGHRQGGGGNPQKDREGSGECVADGVPRWGGHRSSTVSSSPRSQGCGGNPQKHGERSGWCGADGVPRWGGHRSSVVSCSHTVLGRREIAAGGLGAGDYDQVSDVSSRRGTTGQSLPGSSTSPTTADQQTANPQVQIAPDGPASGQVMSTRCMAADSADMPGQTSPQLGQVSHKPLWKSREEMVPVCRGPVSNQGFHSTKYSTIADDIRARAEPGQTTPGVSQARPASCQKRSEEPGRVVPVFKPKTSKTTSKVSAITGTPVPQSSAKIIPTFKPKLNRSSSLKQTKQQAQKGAAPNTPTHPTKKGVAPNTPTHPTKQQAQKGVAPNTPTHPTKQQAQKAVAPNTPTHPTKKGVAPNTPTHPTKKAVAPNTPTHPTKKGVAPNAPTHPTKKTVAPNTPTHPTKKAVATNTPTHPTKKTVATNTPTHPTKKGVAPNTPTHPAAASCPLVTSSTEDQQPVGTPASPVQPAFLPRKPHFNTAFSGKGPGPRPKVSSDKTSLAGKLKKKMGDGVPASGGNSGGGGVKPSPLTSSQDASCWESAGQLGDTVNTWIPTPAVKRKAESQMPGGGGEKKARSKPQVQDVNVELLAKSDQLSKVNTVTLMTWLKERGVHCKTKDKKADLVDRVKVFLAMTSAEP